MSVTTGWAKVLPFFEEELQALILDNTISDLMINGTTGVYADRGGVVEHIPLKNTYTVERLEAAIQRVARLMGQDLTTQNPILNTRMPDGSRVAVVGAPSSIGGPTLTIRKFNRWYSTDELIASGSMPPSVRDQVVAFLMKKKNGIIAGGTGSGKTTLMKAILDHVPETDRLIVIEQVAELRVKQPNAVRWEAVDAIPGQVAVLPSALLAAALRHRPDRIIFGEIRDECANDLLQAMNTGHGGTLTTLHAKSAWDALSRLSNLALSARPNINHSFIRSETAEAIDFVLYCERQSNGRRRVRELIAVNGYDFATQAFVTEDLSRAEEIAAPAYKAEPVVSNYPSTPHLIETTPEEFKNAIA
jgi:pilus assembly protein CpaF